MAPRDQLLPKRSSSKTSSRTWAHRWCARWPRRPTTWPVDGTTTATVLAHAILREGMKSVTAGMNPMDVKRGVENQVVEEIQKKSKKVKDTAEIAQVGTVAANGDKTIGSMIAKAMQKVGN